MRLLRSRTTSWLVPVVIGSCIAAGIASGAIADVSSRKIVLIAIYALVVAGFNVSYGFGGQLALGQVAVFAAGAYTASILSKNDIHELSIAIVLAVAAAAVLGVVSGIPGMRLSEFALAITAFFLVILVPNLVLIFEDQTNGTVGIAGIVRPTLFGVELDQRAFNTFAVVVTVVVLLLCRNLVVGRYGNTLLQLKTSPNLVRSLGMSPIRLRISSYVLGSLPAGVAGALFAYHSKFVEPSMFNFALVTLMLAASVVGGVKSVWGAAVGAALLVVGPDQMASFERWSVLVYGIFLVAAGVGFSEGIAGLSRRVVDRAIGPAVRAPDAASEGIELSVHGECLTVDGVTKSFGGVHALRGAVLKAEPARVTAIIGANGAGKTTLLNVVSGLLQPDSGTVRLGSQELIGLAPATIARHGVARTFQTPLVPEDLTVLDVAMSGRVAGTRIGPLRIALRSPRLRRAEAHDAAAAQLALEFTGLGAATHSKARDLPLGSRRLLEVARCLAAEPRLLLLDEPAAGLDEDSLSQLGVVIEKARDAGSTVILVEHNVEFVMGLADHVVVLDLGETIASGRPEDVRTNEQVITQYLGAPKVDGEARVLGPVGGPRG